MDADIIDYTSNTEFAKKVPQHPRNRLRRKIKRKKIKKKKNKNKKSKQKTNIQKIIKNVFDDLQDKKPVIKIKDEITDADFEDKSNPAGTRRPGDVP